MSKWWNITFEGKHIDEKVLHYCRPSKYQTFYEILKIEIPVLLISVIFILVSIYELLSFSITIPLIAILWLISSCTVAYKIYRFKNNYLFITSKRILFHWMEWLFKDYVKKISYSNIRNVNFFTESLFWKIFKYGSLEIQSSHGWEWDITVYHIEHGKMLTHYIDKIMHLSPEQRDEFAEFDPEYFKNWKQ